VADLKKGARITGTQRDKLAVDLKKKYVHRVLSENGVTLRGRGGATRTKKSK
jgi:Helix-turn-helix domain